MTSIKTYRGRTYKDSMESAKAETLRSEKVLRESLNYTQALIQEPEEFKVTAGHVAERIEHWLTHYRITIHTRRYISEEGLLEVIRQKSDATEVNRILEKAKEYTTSMEMIDRVISSTVFGIIGIQKDMEVVSSLNQHLKKGKYRENESILTTKESYERSFLKKEGSVADLFFISGGVSNSSIDINKGNMKFRNVPDLGYIVFNLGHTDRFPLAKEIYCDGKFTGPCQITLSGSFEAVDDKIFKESIFRFDEWVLSEDNTWGAVLTDYSGLNGKHILVRYCKIFDEGVYDFKDIFFEFTHRTREELSSRGINVAW